MLLETEMQVRHPREFEKLPCVPNPVPGSFYITGFIHDETRQQDIVFECFTCARTSTLPIKMTQMVTSTRHMPCFLQRQCTSNGTLARATM